MRKFQSQGVHHITIVRDHDIAQDHLTDAIELLVARSRRSLSDDRSPRDPH